MDYASGPNLITLALKIRTPFVAELRREEDVNAKNDQIGAVLLTLKTGERGHRPKTADSVQKLEKASKTDSSL